ncbi:putative bifunctional diguanylate cyclase/phosphodiesterase [Tunturibacter empetritectus]|uniref:Diguanylate cyclase (GGDEF)-like protein n=1 Tax=Tunturiibacter lichenicola TaxID=2051959 RepID=A0A7W8N3U9_9BACT|nr:EAL domain-containing protein [Edaphobacter lichenicola]MBB5343803.1 diguanylate cyclase (GGDEF)-like protein [Edaphobacter lichenicola]
MSASPVVDARWIADYDQGLEGTAHLLEQERAATNATEAGFLRQAQKNHRIRLWVERMDAATPLLLLSTILCMGWLKPEMRLQVSHCVKIEMELRQERSSLENRIEARTAELQSEVKERMRVEQLNRGRNQVLEMLARDEPTEEIFRILVEVLARHRSTWACALHLLEGGALHLKASADVPEKLIRNLQQLSAGMTGVPELEALSQSQALILADLTAERRPWTELLRGNGIQSLWSTPFFGPEKNPLGTLTIYALLQYPPFPADLELLETHSQMAAMVLERCRLQEELRRHAYHDSLTALPNRLLGQERLATAIRRAKRNGKSIAVLWIDLNRFKQINDMHGHAAGDSVLRQVAERLSKRLRESDTVARMGGDEFMAVLEDIPGRADAKRVAGALLETLKLPVEFEDLKLSITASIGISLFPEDGDSADELERNADLAMYEAKFGNHGTRAFTPILNQALSDRRELEGEMASALEHRGFELHYQPQCDREGRVAAFEALLRFTHPTLGVVPPSRLIPIAEESQMIIPLGTWVLREACRQNRQWQLEGHPPVRVAVNISSMQFAREDFADRVAEVLEETGLSPVFLELELTESVVVKDFAESTRQLQRLKRLGVSIAIDDFGTGYSSLNYLNRLPIDRLKIDRSFIQVLHEPNSTLPILEAIISMAKNMELGVVGKEWRRRSKGRCFV